MEYGDGTIYQRCDTRRGCPATVEGPLHPKTGKPTRVRPVHEKCRGLWIGAKDIGWTTDGKRDRVTVSGTTRRAVVAALRKRAADMDAGLSTGGSDRITVKQWADEYLELRKLPPKALSPNGWNAAASPIRKWIIPTIGRKRLSALTPGDRRAVALAQYEAGRKTSTADATDRTLQTMLNRAVLEGHKVPQNVLKMQGPGPGKSDRLDVTVADAIACLAVAQELPHGIRWALTLLYGARQGEMLGLVETDPIDGSTCVDFDNRVIKLAWQLQALQRDHGCAEKGKPPTCGKKKGAYCPDAQWRIPRDYVAYHLVDSYHLVRPKSKAGIRVLPMVEPVAESLKAWLKIRPENDWGLLFPSGTGRPCNSKVDREEWWAIQGAAGEVGHPAGRYWHQHECRNLAATNLDEVGASDNVVTSLLGHASILTSRGYQTAHLDAKRKAMVEVAKRMGMIGFDDQAGDTTTTS